MPGSCSGGSCPRPSKSSSSSRRSSSSGCSTGNCGSSSYSSSSRGSSSYSSGSYGGSSCSTGSCGSSSYYSGSYGDSSYGSNSCGDSSSCGSRSYRRSSCSDGSCGPSYESESSGRRSSWQDACGRRSSLQDICGNFSSSGLSNLLMGPAAAILGKGLQAAGVGIPISDNSSKVIDGLRSFGVPVPPKNWFKPKDNNNTVGSSPSGSIFQTNSQSTRTKRTVYDELEEHVHGIIQVAKPIIELKKAMTRDVHDNYRRSTEDRRQAQTPSPREEPRYYSPQQTYSGNDKNNNYNTVSPQQSSAGNYYNALPPQQAVPNKAYLHPQSIEREKVLNKRHVKFSADSAGSDEEIESCLYCGKARGLRGLPCGHKICTKCDEIENHEEDCSQLNMAPKAKAKKAVSNPTDVIDLTQDSPINRAFRLPINPVVPNFDGSLNDSESVIPLDDTENTPRPRRSRSDQPEVIMDLEDTINLEDSTSDIRSNKVPKLTKSPDNKRGLSCPICFESYADENIVPMTTPCGHVYCLSCLKKVARSKKVCSLCQRSIKFSDCLRLHL